MQDNSVHGSFQLVMKFLADQMTAIMEVESDLRQEYSIRRRMLIERAKVIWDLHRFKNEDHICLEYCIHLTHW